MEVEMEMTGNVAIEGHGLDQEAIEHINRLRQWRMSLVRQQLLNVDETGAELLKRGLITLEDFEHDELKAALQEKIDGIADRLKRPDVIYQDEVEFYLKMAHATEEGDEEDADDD